MQSMPLLTMIPALFARGAKHDFWDYDASDRARAAEIAKGYAVYHSSRRRYIPGENKHDK